MELDIQKDLWRKYLWRIKGWGFVRKTGVSWDRIKIWHLCKERGKEGRLVRRSWNTVLRN